MNITPFISIWFRPQATMALVGDVRSKLSHFGLIALLTLLFLVEGYIFLWLTDFPKFVDLFQWKGAVLFLVAFLLISATVYTLLTSVALFVWMMARSLGGKADIFKTRTALLWSMLTLLPIGIVISLILFLEMKGAAISKNMLQRPTRYILAEQFCFFALFAAVTYPFFHYIKTISKVHTITNWRALISLLSGTIVGILLVLFLSKVIFP